MWRAIKSLGLNRQMYADTYENKRSSALGETRNIVGNCYCNRCISCSKEQREQKISSILYPRRKQLPWHTFPLFLGSVSSESAQKIHLFPPSKRLSFSPPSCLLSRISLPIRWPVDYYATATITFPRRHPLSWLFASLRSTRRNYLANPLKERKRRET